jgi:hypothetical protein
MLFVIKRLIRSIFEKLTSFPNFDKGEKVFLKQEGVTCKIPSELLKDYHLNILGFEVIDCACYNKWVSVRRLVDNKRFTLDTRAIQIASN